MKKLFASSLLVIMFIFITTAPVFADVQRIYDEANLLTDAEVQELEAQASAYFDEWQTDFIIITTNDTEGRMVTTYMQDFTDELAKEFNRSEDNMAVLTMDMQNREVYLAGFGIGKEYLDDARLDQIRNQITSDLSNGNYYDAFEHFFAKSDEYLNIRPGVNPESLFFNTFVQLGAALVLAFIVVFIMAFNSGGRVTVNARTYLDQQNTRIVSQHDRYLRKTVTRKKKPSNNSSGGGGGRMGGGGISSAGRSHSGSRGGF
ncbi:TPM domain-containing protein [Oceanobacillus sp. CAU 1775]